MYISYAYSCLVLTDSSIIIILWLVGLLYFIQSYYGGMVANCLQLIRLYKIIALLYIIDYPIHNTVHCGLFVYINIARQHFIFVLAQLLFFWWATCVKLLTNIENYHTCM